MNKKEIKEVVKFRYGKSAEKIDEESCCCSTRASTNNSFATEHGLYTMEELSLIPERVRNISKGCGNPTGYSHIKPGNLVVDFGCGAGIDLVLAAHKTGITGRVIGVDFTPQMVNLGKQSLANLKNKTIEFLVADIENTGLPNNFADVVLSNCVINLCADKEAVYKEAFRILKSGGHLAISDVIFTENIQPEIKERFQRNWVGCLGGAVEEKEYFDIIREAGFQHIKEVARHCLAGKELEAMASCPDADSTPTPAKADLASIEGKVMSIKFTAVKP